MKNKKLKKKIRKLRKGKNRRSPMDTLLKEIEVEEPLKNSVNMKMCNKL
jgi:hypothetical protein